MIKSRRRQPAAFSLALPLAASKPQNDEPSAPKPPLTMSRVWILRALVPLNCQCRFVKDRGFDDDGLALHLGLDRFVGLNAEDFEPNIVKEELRAAHAEAEANLKQANLPERVTRNIERLGALVGLSEVDKRILELRVELASNSWLWNACEYLGGMTSSSHTIAALSEMLDLPPSSVRKALDSRGMLARSGLLTADRRHCHDLRDSLDLISCDFADLISNGEPEPIEFLRDTILPSSAAHLTLDDFGHLGDQVGVLRSYVRKSIETKRTGVNILLHGSPGTGKSQFGKALAQELGVATYEVSSEDASGDVIDAEGRLRAYRAAQGILSNTSCLIVFDETEDIFQAPVPRRGRLDVDSNGRKAWINRMLESNTLPALWITNAVANIDPAFLRRFDMIIEFSMPPLNQRKKIAEQACNGLLDNGALLRLAQCESLSPAVVARAASVIKFVEADLGAISASSALEKMVDQTLSAQGHAGLSHSAASALPQSYDPLFTRADSDLAAMSRGIAKTGSARVCLYGPPGTGKTAWAKWLSEQTGKPLLVKRASDLTSKYVGGTEKLIAAAFKRAETEGAILLLDEVDSFLRDRRLARNSWEVTEVNEMLTQMESFGGVFIASTNLMDNLDDASLRRFDLKVRFDYLDAQQARALLAKTAEILDLPSPDEALMQRVGLLGQLTPGDFATVSRQHRFRPLADTAQLVNSLAAETGLKRGGAKGVMGFL